MELGLCTILKTQNYGEACRQCIVYRDTTNLKDEYAPNEIAMKIAIFVEFGTVLLLPTT